MIFCNILLIVSTGCTQHSLLPSTDTLVRYVQPLGDEARTLSLYKQQSVHSVACCTTRQWAVCLPSFTIACAALLSCCCWPAPVSSPPAAAPPNAAAAPPPAAAGPRRTGSSWSCAGAGGAWASSQPRETRAALSAPHQRSLYSRHDSTIERDATHTHTHAHIYTYIYTHTHRTQRTRSLVLTQYAAVLNHNIPGGCAAEGVDLFDLFDHLVSLDDTAKRHAAPVEVL